MQLHRQLASFLRAFRFPIFKLSGASRFGRCDFHILYAGAPLFRGYLQSVAFKQPPNVEYLGKRNLSGLRRLSEEHLIDLTVFRSHLLLARAGFFPNDLYVPEWISGIASFGEQANYERTSKSRQRDRSLLKKNDIDYVVTTAEADLNYFYDEMYVPHITASHADAAFLMSRKKMLQRMNDGEAELVSIRLAGREVGGSLIVYDNGQPRLNSCGVLNNDRTLLRDGVGVAIYLCSFDHLAGNGFDKVHMGYSRALLSDGGLYFKRRLGLRVTGTTTSGYYFRPARDSAAMRDFLANTGFIHIRRNSTRAAIFADTKDMLSQQTQLRQRELAENLGIRKIDFIESGGREIDFGHRISNVSVAHNDS